METVELSPNDPNFFEEYKVEVRNDQSAWIEKLKELREQILSGNLERDFSIYGSWITSFHFDHHLFYPLLCLRDKDSNGKKLLVDKNTNEPLIKISPVALNVGETSFVKRIREYYEANKFGILRDKDVYLLRNESRKGIGFFEASGFYPDFILWVNDGSHQHVTFIDPKGIRNLKGMDDPKIQLYKTLKNEVEPTLQDADITLDSYILSNTDYSQVKFWGPKPKFIENHVLFDNDNDYLDSLFQRIIQL